MMRRSNDLLDSFEWEALRDTFQSEGGLKENELFADGCRFRTPPALTRHRWDNSGLVVREVDVQRDGALVREGSLR